MSKQILKFGVFLVIVSLLTVSCPSAFARENSRGNDRGNNRGDNRGYDNGNRYYYRDGRYYQRGWFGWGAVVSALAIGALIESLPPKHTVVVVGDTRYYHDDRYYYREVPEGGYVVVATPVIVQTRYPVPETSTINIPNSRGGYTSVTLIRSGDGFVGPQGEYYQNYPTVAQLKTIYGN